MVELTVGYVSGVIAAAVFFTQLFVPLALALILVGILSEKHSAVSWSVVSRLLHGSYWPVLAAADSAAGRGVSKRVQFLAWLQPLVLGLIAIAAIITPLGLFDEISPDDDPIHVAFQYVPDTSPFGKATPPRSEFKSLRICFDTSDGCPGAPPNISSFNDTTKAYQVWPSSVDFFTSGTTPFTVSSMFDIDWRSYYISKEVSRNSTGATSFSKGFYRQLSVLALDEKIEAVDGLVVDTKSGQIGFRNHTIPVNFGHGVQWTEDILFIEPETKCVNTNLTIDYILEGGAFETIFIIEPRLVDQGGFVSIDHNQPKIDSRDFQQDPKLYERAYSVAWNMNMMIMQYFNVTTNGSDGAAPFSYMNSQLGKRFTLVNDTGHDTVGLLKPNSFQTSSVSGSFLSLPSDYEYSNDPAYANYTKTDQTGPNPWNLTSRAFTQMGIKQCMSPGKLDQANISAVGVHCGLVFGAHKRLDGNPLFPAINSTWSMPIYSCATATKAVIKEVDFKVNTTKKLEDLTIERVRDKVYESRADMPLWGVERLRNSTIRNVRPFWGVVSHEVGARDDINTIQRGHLWLPGFSDVTFGDPVGAYGGEANLPGNLAPMQAISTTYDVQSSGSNKWNALYTGENDIALYEKWRVLCENATGTELILNLIWTDTMANSVIGTRGWLSKAGRHTGGPKTLEQAGSSPDVLVSATIWSRKIKYHFVYAIPAVIVLFATILIAATTVFLLLMRRTGKDKVDLYLRQTSAGRILGTFLFPGSGDPLANRREWIRQVGVQPVVLVKGKTLGKGSQSYTNVPVTEEIVSVT